MYSSRTCMYNSTKVIVVYEGSSVPYIHSLGYWESGVAGADCHARDDHIHRLAHDEFTHPYIPYIHWLTQLSATARSSPWVHVSVSNPGSQCGRYGVLVRGNLLGTVTFASSHSYLVSVYFWFLYVCMCFCFILPSEFHAACGSNEPASPEDKEDHPALHRVLVGRARRWWCIHTYMYSYSDIHIIS